MEDCGPGHPGRGPARGVVESGGDQAEACSCWLALAVARLDASRSAFATVVSWARWTLDQSPRNAVASGPIHCAPSSCEVRVLAIVSISSALLMSCPARLRTAPMSIPSMLLIWCFLSLFLDLWGPVGGAVRSAG